MHITRIGYYSECLLGYHSCNCRSYVFLKMATIQCKQNIDSFFCIYGELIIVRSKTFILVKNVNDCEVYETNIQF